MFELWVECGNAVHVDNFDPLLGRTWTVSLGPPEGRAGREPVSNRAIWSHFYNVASG
jgi:hypothetical protein